MFKTSRWEVFDVVITLSTEKAKAGEEGNDSFKFSRFSSDQPQYPCISWICLFQGKSVFHCWTSGAVQGRLSTDIWSAEQGSGQRRGAHCSVLMRTEAVSSSDDDEAGGGGGRLGRDGEKHWEDVEQQKDQQPVPREHLHWGLLDTDLWNLALRSGDCWSVVFISRIELHLTAT